MTRMRIMGLSLAAVFAMAAMATASASAAPSFYECAKVAKVGKFYTGKYNDKNCTEVNSESHGKYELVAGVGKGKAFKGKGAGAVLHTPAVGGEVTCKGSKDEGFNTLTGQDKVKVTFTGCVSLAKPCNSPGAKKGEIKTNPLSGTLGYISATGPKVGVSLTGEGGLPSAEFACGTGAGSLNIVTTGAVIGEITGDVNHINKEATDSFTVTGEGFQSVTSFEDGSTQVLETSINGSPNFQSGEQTTTVNKGEALEIKA
jgi:hypothetical protein